MRLRPAGRPEGPIRLPTGGALPCALVATLVTTAVVATAVLWRGASGPGPLLGVAGLGLGVLIGVLAHRCVVAGTLESRVNARTLELGTREEWFRSLVHNSSDVLAVADEHGVLLYVSSSVTRMLGHDPAALTGRRLSALLRPSDARRFATALLDGGRGHGRVQRLELGVRHAEGHWCETETTVSSRVDDPRIRGHVLNIRDVSERKRLEQELTHQAFHDGLTGLANRALFRDRVERALADVEVGGQVAVLFCDLDGFKAVNDAQGHAVGDHLLGLVAERLQHCVRPGDLVARLGGDEFAILVRDAEAERAAVGVAERVRSVLGQPFVLDGREISVGVSTGIAVTGRGAETAEVLLRNADLAMYRAKGQQGSGYVRFEASMHRALLSRLKIETDLRSALGRGELALHYQPTVDLRNGRFVGVEALLRWYHPERGIVSPQEFVAVAEEVGLIAEIGEWALQESCRRAAGWQRFGSAGGPFHVAVNISGRQLGGELPEIVGAALADSGLPPEALILELTESVLMERTAESLAALGRIKELGARIAVDDFGTGYSSLSYLSRFPVDILKIDRSFVEKVPEASAEAELARTIVSLGGSLGLQTVAEGIENRRQLDALREMGCDFGQGFLFARALPASGLDELLALRAVAPPAPALAGGTGAPAGSHGVAAG